MFVLKDGLVCLTSIVIVTFCIVPPTMADGSLSRNSIGSESTDAQDDQSDTTQEPKRPITAEQRKQVVIKMAKFLREEYAIAKIGEEMARSAEQSLANGDYDKLDETLVFAYAVMAELRKICNDKHFGLRTTFGGNWKQFKRPSNQYHGFVRVEYLKDRIGYVKLNNFGFGPEAEQVATSAMNFLAGSRALIIDVRDNEGGSPNMVSKICGHLLKKPTLMARLIYRKSGQAHEICSHEEVDGHRFDRSVPVFILTSGTTYSAGEGLAYTLKHLGRAVIVGETTGGGAHPVKLVDLGSGIGMYLPHAITFNPITKTSWEGCGVKPDVTVATEDALERAASLARKTLADMDEKKH